MLTGADSVNVRVRAGLRYGCVCEVSGALFVHVCVRLRCHCVPASILPP